MLTRFFLLITLSLLLIACAHGPVKNQQLLISTKNNALQTRALAPFNQVMISGPINVNLHAGYARSQIILRGDPRDLSQVIATVTNGKLSVFSKGYPQFGAVSIEIYSRNLNGLTYRGSGIITGNDLHSSLLDLDITNSNTTTLSGNIFLRRITVNGDGLTRINGIRAQNLQLSMSGNPKVELVGIINLSFLKLKGAGRLSMYWVKSSHLTVEARDKAFVQLAGISDQLHVQLWDNAHFNGRYLRANQAFIKTHDQAIAELSAVKKQHSLATDASDIYFYNLPKMKSDFMAYNGAVLDMRAWSLAAAQEYSRYNK